MKPWILLTACLAALILWAAVAPRAMAGSGEKIKDGTQKAVSEIRKEAVRAGRAAAETGREIKEGAVKTGKAIKESVNEVGQGVKKAYQETRDTVTREFSKDPRKPSDP